VRTRPRNIILADNLTPRTGWLVSATRTALERSECAHNELPAELFVSEGSKLPICTYLRSMHKVPQEAHAGFFRFTGPASTRGTAPLDTPTTGDRSVALIALRLLERHTYTSCTAVREPTPLAAVFSARHFAPDLHQTNESARVTAV
jgi:hypothetical protein